MTPDPRNVTDLPTPALVIDADAFQRNLSAMSALLPGTLLRPHVKAHKCTSLAAAQVLAGHRTFTCATPREVVGMVDAGVGDDLLLANESVDPRRLSAMAALQHRARITVAVDSSETVDAAAAAGLTEVLIDVNVGLPRCGVLPDEAGALADLARRRGLAVRGVMGYEGHLMPLTDAAEQRERVAASMALLRRALDDVGGEVVSAGGTGTAAIHRGLMDDGLGVTEVQAGSYALMDTAYTSSLAGRPLRLEQACFVVGTVIAAGRQHAVADVGLKALGMDHGDPTIEGAAVWFCSDEHVTFAPSSPVAVGDRVRVVPAHIDPTMAMHDVAWLVRDDAVLDRWAVDLRGW